MEGYSAVTPHRFPRMPPVLEELLSIAAHWVELFPSPSVQDMLENCWLNITHLNDLMEEFLKLLLSKRKQDSSSEGECGKVLQRPLQDILKLEKLDTIKEAVNSLGSLSRR